MDRLCQLAGVSKRVPYFRSFGICIFGGLAIMPRECLNHHASEWGQVPEMTENDLEKQEIGAPVWCYECKKQFTFRLKAGASQKKLPAQQIERLISSALHASKWQMLDVVNEDGEETGQRTWFCENCVKKAADLFDKRRKKAENPYWKIRR